VIIRGRWNASGVGGGVRSRPKGVICVFVVVVVGRGGGKGMGAGVWVCACGRVGKVKSRERIKERVQLESEGQRSDGHARGGCAVGR
jgi:hypothetical protein